ncbi:aminotransferase class I/II-fold pyridoxal phosphate-dependent enzyme [Shinella sp. BYT-45]|uniref:aminotransferase class I/II-fold pyridoxal phosphate-dependent enzyme n=1 Tax=Shinella sp. BYT-45 TaxID=3377377 RepID=UPI003980CA83
MAEVEKLIVSRKATLREAMSRLEQAGLGILLLVSDEGGLDRTVTDGDIRRLILAGHGLDETLGALPEAKCITAPVGATRRAALELMNRHGISHLPLIDADGRVTELLLRRDIDEQVLLSTPHIGDAEREFVEQAFLTNWIAPLGPNVDAFETELCAFVGSAHGAAVSSGTAAIHLGLRLLGVGPGDRVFCSTLTFAASANPIVYQGAEPVFIDSEASSWNMCPRALERAFSTAASEGWRPKAVIVVNLYGQSADMDPILDLCAAYGVPVLEDAAESLGATYKGRQSGTFGRIGVFSFNGNKIITTSGGGMLVSDDEEIVARARFLATQARDPAPHYQHSEIGYNYRMSNILAGVGRGQLRVLESRVATRRGVFERYREGLADTGLLEWMPEPDWSFSNRWLTTAAVSPDAAFGSGEIIRRLAGELIEARPVWKPMHLQPVFAGTRYFTAGNSSVSDDLFERGICLPSGSNMSEEQLDRVISTLKSLLR